MNPPDRRKQHLLEGQQAGLATGRCRDFRRLANFPVKLSILAALLTPIGGKVVAATTPAADTRPEAGLENEAVLVERRWIHGSSDCSVNSDPAFDVYAFDQTTFILRQNKCMTFEAPFIYLLVGESKALVLDTGAIEGETDNPLYQLIGTILGQGPTDPSEILVIHSHGHRDHYKGDAQFRNKPGVTLVEPSRDSFVSFFGFEDWPNAEARVDLGGRTLIVFPTPGHQEESIAVYDAKTKWLLTGDTLYPGYIYVKDWDDYKSSIARLAQFAESNEVVAILGSHIEMTTEAGKYYPIGTTFQPDEAPLPLSTDSLRALNRELQSSNEKDELVFDQFIVAPMNFVQIALSNIARWITQ